MNIDLRNISEQFEKEVNRVKKEYGISTNSKAVEYCVNNYLDMVNENKKLRSELNQEKQNFDNLRNNVKSFSQALTRLNEIT